jgi:hypothetical protein
VLKAQWGRGRHGETANVMSAVEAVRIFSTLAHFLNNCLLKAELIVINAIAMNDLGRIGRHGATTSDGLRARAGEYAISPRRSKQEKRSRR